MLGFIDYLSRMALASQDDNGEYSQTNSMAQSLAHWDKELYNQNIKEVQQQIEKVNEHVQT